ncbi:hypothetical protein T02_9559 [Trichinella nativa]|uniref:Uncharacterized protein n=1 Tax=Trichinella nativa TaxID=6335 RepID=A0A0V1L5P0_9BILA|nr:hypothetical protein T02_9559 [Trichinella nativa]
MAHALYDYKRERAESGQRAVRTKTSRQTALTTTNKHHTHVRSCSAQEKANQKRQARVRPLVLIHLKNQPAAIYPPQLKRIKRINRVWRRPEAAINTVLLRPVPTRKFNGLLGQRANVAILLGKANPGVKPTPENFAKLETIQPFLCLFVFINIVYERQTQVKHARFFFFT